MKIGCFCPVWCETRYLPLVVEQMGLCPGPRLLLWMDEPFHWYGKGPAPSGYNSDVARIVNDNPFLRVLRRQAHSDLETNQIAYDWMAERGVEAVVRFDSDWLFTLEDTAVIYRVLDAAPNPGGIERWNALGVHYWKTFDRIYDNVVVGIASPISVPNTWQAFSEETVATLPYPFCYHPSYVLTDEECLRKISSWEHAKLFYEQNFYSDRWLKDDIPTWRGPKPPDEIMQRLSKHGALL